MIPILANSSISTEPLFGTILQDGQVFATTLVPVPRSVIRIDPEKLVP